MLLDVMSLVARVMPAPWGQGIIIIWLLATSISFASTAAIHFATSERWMSGVKCAVICTARPLA